MDIIRHKETRKAHPRIAILASQCGPKRRCSHYRDRSATAHLRGALGAWYSGPPLECCFYPAPSICVAIETRAEW
ncbi:hypothetical protein JYU34_016230 [Plutella xylostella]|uniref:Uncharacterized protein n=1 Tax=Plutella xylostella TaxID=51655 RepID=A0ABQ7Q261_PLUXY|nr:hypothetical protein JYU34_016230 [Plutella xylostella]